MSDRPGQPRRSTTDRQGHAPGVWVIGALALLSSVAIFAWPVRPPDGVQMWTFARLHKVRYEAVINQWPRDEQPAITLLSMPALERRMLSAFLTQTPSADLIEAERRTAARAFVGPLESVGFVDLTDRLKAEGLDQDINAPSFSPWTSRGRVFGLPHDVHPVMLGYRADIVEAAGIDVSTIETWDDFIRVLSPLMGQRDAAGKPARYLLNLWEDKDDLIEILLLQAGGGFFDESEQVAIATATNARVLVTIIAWCRGPDRIASDAPDFTASGNQLKAEGYVLAAMMPDWMCNVWKTEIPPLSGKIKLMPMPAWERGGRRTSVWGGTMLGIAKASPDHDKLWNIAKRLYTSREIAREIYREGDIVTPVRSLWDDPVFDEPDPYFSNQRKARMFIDLAPTVPRRTSSPFNTLAKERVRNATLALSVYAQSHREFDPEKLMPEAMRLLQAAEKQVRTQIERNVFLSEPTPAVSREGRP
jgi:arabinosaccharide transport system substrate-binding protein